MELHNLIFISLISMLIVYGTVIVITDSGRTNAYINSSNATSIMQLNESLTNISRLINKTGEEITAGQSQGSGLDILLGLSQNVFNGAKNLFQMSIFTTGIATQLIIFNQLIPPWILNFIIPSILGMVIIGVMYYLSKVK